MKNNNVEKDLLEILQSKNKVDLIYTIMRILNGTYEYEIDYLNDIPNNEIKIHLEKLISICNKKSFYFTEDARCIDDIKLFIKRLPYMIDMDLDKLSILSVKYDLLLTSEKLSKIHIDNDKLLKALSGILIFAVLATGTKTIAKSFNSHDELNDNSAIDSITELVDLPSKIELLKTIEEKPVIMSDEEILNSKINSILEAYNITREEFDVVVAIAMAEAKEGSYLDTYAVVTTMCNRINSRTWVDYISSLYDAEVGTNIYYQAITDGQFVVYESGRYKEFLNNQEGDSFNAVVDCLTDNMNSKRLMHNCLSFKSADTPDYYIDGDVIQFEEGGNKYHDLMPIEDRIINEENLNIH